MKLRGYLVTLLAAGGIGTPLLLRQAGLEGAGQGISMDTTVIVYGAARFKGNGREPPMTYAWESEEGFMLSTLVDPWLMYPIITALKGWRYPLTWPRWPNMLGVMIKLKDDVSGGVFPNGRISKPMTGHDRSRMRAAEEVCRRILIEAGARPETIFTTPLRPEDDVGIREVLEVEGAWRALEHVGAASTLDADRRNDGS